MERFKYTVCTRCVTYNHSKYIEDALNGFCTQETMFPVVYVIIDDASTDGTQKVIKDYYDNNFRINDGLVARNEETNDFLLYYAQHNTNKNCYFTVILLKYNHYIKKKSKLPYYLGWLKQAKYHASCEGDDYWTDSRKLQKQYEFLSKHEEFSMCFHNAKILNVDIEGSITERLLCDREVTADEVFYQWSVPTASIVCKKEALDYHTKGNSRILHGDIVLILKCAELGKIWGMKDEMSVYRVHSDSAIHNIEKVERDRFKKPQHFKFIRDNFHCVNKKMVREKIGVAYFDCFCRSLRSPFKAFYYLVLSLYYNPIIVFKFIVSYVRRRKVC